MTSSCLIFGQIHTLQSHAVEWRQLMRTSWFWKTMWGWGRNSKTWKIANNTLYIAVSSYLIRTILDWKVNGLQDCCGCRKVWKGLKKNRGKNKWNWVHENFYFIDIIKCKYIYGYNMFYFTGPRLFHKKSWTLSICLQACLSPSSQTFDSGKVVFGHQIEMESPSSLVSWIDWKE